jgi:hypothetical protein
MFGRYTKALAPAALAVAMLTSPSQTMAASAQLATYSSTTNTVATCLVRTDAMAGVKYVLIVGYFPRGTTSGPTYLAARAQDADVTGTIVASHPWVKFANGSYWATTNASRFPYGQFAVSGSWYTSMQISYTQDWQDNRTVYRRIQFELVWPDGTTTFARTQWAVC